MVVADDRLHDPRLRPLSFINSPDLARYLPRSTKPSHIIAATALGGGIPNIIFTAIGALVATGLGSDAGIVNFAETEKLMNTGRTRPLAI